MEAVPKFLRRTIGSVLLDHLGQGREQLAECRVSLSYVGHDGLVVLFTKLVAATADHAFDDDQAVPEPLHLESEVMNGSATSEVLAKAHLFRGGIGGFQICDHQAPRLTPVLALLPAQVVLEIVERQVDHLLAVAQGARKETLRSVAPQFRPDADTRDDAGAASYTHRHGRSEGTIEVRV